MHNGVAPAFRATDQRLADDPVVRSQPASAPDFYSTWASAPKFKAGDSSVDVQIKPTTPPVGVLFSAFSKKVTLTLKDGSGYTVATPEPAKVKIVRTSGIILP